MFDSMFFNAHHSPTGAFASFTLGYKGASGGFGLECAGPANQNIYIGLQSESGELYEFLPFYGAFANDRERYDTTENSGNGGMKIIPFADKDIKRTFNLGSDIWNAKDLTFKIFSPVMSMPDPSSAPAEALKRACIPAVFVEVTVDNSEGITERGAVFGFQGTDPYSAMRHIRMNSPSKLCGIGQGLRYGIFSNDKEVQSGLAFSIDDLIFPKDNESLRFGLGTTGGLLFSTPAKTIRTWKFAVCFYVSGQATTVRDSRYFYTHYFSSLEDVAAYGILHADYYRERAIISDKMISSSGLSDERAFTLCHAIRSYYGSTELLNVGGNPCWIVNEGEYRMINTFDLTIDHLFFEMKMNPWTIKNILDKYTSEYSYYDHVHLPGGTEEYPGGISFTHDMGVGNVFSTPQFSAYEIGELSGCFSYMTHEQLVNWILCATIYVSQTNDNDWIYEKKTVVKDCLSSMLNRDHYDPLKRDGVMDFDSSRTGRGEEITTYDNVDRSLGRARRNAYLALKCWAAYLGLEKLFSILSLGELAIVAKNQAEMCAETICQYIRPDGTIPALLEEQNKSVLIPVIEGLVFPYYFNKELLGSDGPFRKLVEALRAHCRVILQKGVCLFEDNGWKLSSTSDNSWLSKIYLCQFITEKILQLPCDKQADRAHLNWLLDTGNSYYAWSDQMLGGKVCGSRYYPRGVTAVLWLHDLMPE